MKQADHVLTEIDFVKKIAICSIDGAVPILVTTRLYKAPSKARCKIYRWQIKKYGRYVGKPPADSICILCEQVKKLTYDHDHKSKTFRGWICFNCNFLLGHAQDDPQILRKAANYLDAHSS